MSLSSMYALAGVRTDGGSLHGSTGSGVGGGGKEGSREGFANHFT